MPLEIAGTSKAIVPAHRARSAKIGRASADIAPGEHVHSHNLATSLSGLEAYAYAPAAPAALPRPEATFQGYRRRNGRVGTRNEIWILCTVGCVTRTAQRIAAEADRRFKDRVDGVHALTHPFGCSQLGDDLSATRKMIAALDRAFGKLSSRVDR